MKRKGNSTTYIMKDGVNPQALWIILLIAVPSVLGIGYWLGMDINYPNAFNDGYDAGVPDGIIEGNATGFALGNSSGYEQGLLDAILNSTNDEDLNDTLSELRMSSITFGQLNSIYMRINDSVTELITTDDVVNYSISFKITKEPSPSESVIGIALSSKIADLSAWYNNESAIIDDYPIADWWTGNTDLEGYANALMVSLIGDIKQIDPTESISITLYLDEEGNLIEDKSMNFYENQTGNYIIEKITLNSVYISNDVTPDDYFDSEWTSDRDSGLDVKQLCDTTTHSGESFLYTIEDSIFFAMPDTILMLGFYDIVMNLSTNLVDGIPEVNSTTAILINQAFEDLLELVQYTYDANPLCLNLRDGQDITFNFGNVTFMSELMVLNGKNYINSSMTFENDGILYSDVSYDLSLLL